MGGWQDIAKAFVVGVVSIGLATALFMPGRTTADTAKVVLTGAQGLLSTAESGK
jgi:hypothetical protein